MTFDIQAGALVRGTLRRELERIKFLGHDITWNEQKGWLGSNFTIIAPEHIARAIYSALDKWNADEEAAP